MFEDQTRIFVCHRYPSVYLLSRTSDFLVTSSAPSHKREQHESASYTIKRECGDDICKVDLLATPIIPSGVTLSCEQQDVLRRVDDGENIFITGCAGTGKTLLLRIIIERLERQGRRVAKTAPTGLASTHIGGTTIHSFAGIGDSNKDQFSMLSSILGEAAVKILEDRLGEPRSRRSSIDHLKVRKPDVFRRWRETQVLIIDESTFQF